MSYYPRGHRVDASDEFEDYDPTPYGGGYDQALTYGRPLPPSEEICYPPSTSSGIGGDFDYDRPNYSSHAQPSAYAEEALDNEYKGYARPGRPGPAPVSYGGGAGGFQPNLPTPGYAQEPTYGAGSGYGRKNEYEYDTQPGSGYGRKNEYESAGSEYGRKNEYGSGGSEYGRKTEHESEYGSAYGRKNEFESAGSEYGRKNEYGSAGSEYGSGYGGRKSEYGGGESEYGSGYGRKNEYEGGESGYGRKSEHGSEYGSGYGRKDEHGSEYGTGYGRKSESEYEKPSYGRTEGEGYGGSSYGYGRDDEDRHEKPHYGRKKKSDDDDSDDEKKRRHHRHHHRKDYDEE